MEFAGRDTIVRTLAPVLGEIFYAEMMMDGRLHDAANMKLKPGIPPTPERIVQARQRLEVYQADAARAVGILQQLKEGEALSPGASGSLRRFMDCAATEIAERLPHQPRERGSLRAGAPDGALRHQRRCLKLISQGNPERPVSRNWPDLHDQLYAMLILEASRTSDLLGYAIGMLLPNRTTPSGEIDDTGLLLD